MRVRLTKKLAECIDGIDISDYRPGDVLDLSEFEARLLLAERWAEVADDERPEFQYSQLQRAS